MAPSTPQLSSESKVDARIELSFYTVGENGFSSSILVKNEV